MKKKMLKLTSLIAAFAITMVSLPASVGAMATKGENLITSSAGFEDGKGSWGGNCWAVVKTEFNSGSASAYSSTRANNYDGPQITLNVEANTDYYISAWVKPESTTANAIGRIRLQNQGSGSGVTSLSNTTFTAGKWTQTSGIVNTGTNTKVKIYVQTTDTAAIYLDDFEMRKVTHNTPEVKVSENMLGENAGFEKGNTTGLGANAATVTLVDEFKANTGDYAALSTKRTASYGGVNSSYIPLKTDTYYYVSAYAMAAEETSVKARVRLQRRTGKDITNKVSDAALSNTAYNKFEAVVYNEDAEEGKVYIQTNEKNLSESSHGIDLYTDDYVLLPITSSVASGATDVTPNADITLTVPEDIEVSKETLSITNGATITNVARTGRECVVSLSGMTYGAEYTLTLTTGIGDNPTYTFTTKAAYETAFSKGDNNTINCTFTNNVNTDKIMLAVAGYSASGQLKYIEIDVSETTSGTLAVSAPADGVRDTVKALLWNMKTLAPVCGALSLSDIPSAE